MPFVPGSVLSLLTKSTSLRECQARAAGLRPRRLKMRATPEKAWRKGCPVEAEYRSLEHVRLCRLCSCNIKNVALLQEQPKLDTDFSQIRCLNNYLIV